MVLDKYVNEFEGYGLLAIVIGGMTALVFFFSAVCNNIMERSTRIGRISVGFATVDGPSCSGVTQVRKY